MYDFYSAAMANEPVVKPASSISATDLLRDIADVLARVGSDEIDGETREHVRSLRHQCLLNGERVFVNPILDDMPKMQLTQAVYDNLPWPFREEVNAWMREFFGTESRIYHVRGVGIFMGRKAYEQMRAAML